MTAAALASIVVASLLGSLHCAGMCGAFVSLACGAGRERTRLQGVYHGGRLIGYSAVGALAGLVGSVIDLGAGAIGVGRVAAMIGAATMLVIAGVMLLEWAGVRVFHGRVKPPAVLMKLFKVGAGVAQRATPMRRAGLIGLMTVLLPCGWLYAFVVIAGATASPLTGAMVMAAFWVGTVPFLAAIGWSAGAIRSRLGAGVKPVAGIVLLGLGAFTLASAATVDESAVRGMLERVSMQSDELPVSADCPLCESGEASE